MKQECFLWNLWEANEYFVVEENENVALVWWFTTHSVFTINAC